MTALTLSRQIDSAMPQIRSLILIALAATTIGGVGFAVWRGEPATTAPSPPPTPVEIALVQRRGCARLSE